MSRIKIKETAWTIWVLLLLGSCQVGAFFCPEDARCLPLLNFPRHLSHFGGSQQGHCFPHQGGQWCFRDMLGSMMPCSCEQTIGSGFNTNPFQFTAPQAPFAPEGGFAAAPAFNPSAAAAAADAAPDHPASFAPSTDFNLAAATAPAFDPAAAAPEAPASFAAAPAFSAAAPAPSSNTTQMQATVPVSSSGEEIIHPNCDLVPQRLDCSADQRTYCPLVDSYYGQHTMCQYCGLDMSKCSRLCSRQLTQQEKDILVNKHNELRAKVANGQERRGSPGPQPPAALMYELKWDDELAAIAQRWADQCPQGHDQNRQTKNKVYVGQNLASAWNSQPQTVKQLSDFVQQWYDEVKDWPARMTASFGMTGAVVGHYTQVVWGKTKSVGCGFIAFVDRSYAGIPYEQLLICNYGPGGNIGTEPIYQIGPTGSACPNGSKGGLCIQ